MESLMNWLQAQLADNSIFTLQTLSYYGEGLVTTVQLVFLSLIIGLVLAVPLAIGRGPSMPGFVCRSSSTATCSGARHCWSSST